MTLWRPASDRPSVRPTDRPTVRAKLKHGQFLGHYEHYSCETWPVGSIRQGLSNHVIEDDLDPKVKVTGDMESCKKSICTTELLPLDTKISIFCQESIFYDLYCFEMFILLTRQTSFFSV